MADAVGEANGLVPDTFAIPPEEAEGIPAQSAAISADEIALYDRQIRLWGVQAQEKIRTASILLLSMNALGNEVAKNLVLAGVYGVTIVDDAIVTADDLGAQFLLTEADIGKNRAEAVVPALQALNPRVLISALPQSPINLLPEFIAMYDVTIAISLSYPALTSLNITARFNNRPFYAAGIHGLYGYIFADLVSHDFQIEREKSNVPVQPGTAESAQRTIISVTPKASEGDGGRPREIVTKREIYSPLQLANTSPLPAAVTNNRRRLRAVPPLLTCIRAMWEFETTSPTFSLPNTMSKTDLSLFTRLATEKHKELQLPMDTLRADFLRSFIQNLGMELAPLSAWIGGQLAQECVNVLSGREQPIQNLAVFDGDSMNGSVYALHPIFDASMVAALPVANAAVPLQTDQLPTNPLPVQSELPTQAGAAASVMPTDGAAPTPVRQTDNSMTNGSETTAPVADVIAAGESAPTAPAATTTAQTSVAPEASTAGAAAPSTEQAGQSVPPPPTDAETKGI